MNVAYVRCRCDECKTTEGVLEGLEDTMTLREVVLISGGCEVKFGESH